jgi:hypothetical protein
MHPQPSPMALMVQPFKLYCFELPAAKPWSMLLTFPRPALRAKIGSDEAEDEDFGHSKARTITKYEPICVATRRAGANFPDLGVARR